MNTKRSKGIMGVMLAIIMIASIFAAIAPSTTADVQSQGVLTQGKSGPATVPATVGGIINFTITVGNPVANSPYSWTGNVYDVPPGADPDDRTTKTGWVLLASGVTLPPDGSTQDWYYEHTITASDVANGSVLNNMAAIGQHADGTWQNGTAQYETDLESQVLPPQFSFEFEAIGCLEVEFNGSASTDDTAIANHTWYYGDGTNSGVIIGPPTTVQHVYSSCGIKTVTLSGYDDEGSYNSTTDVIYVDCGPTASALANPTCFEGEGEMVTFNGSLSHPDTANTYYPQTIVSYSWTFDDNGTGSSDNAAVTSRMVNDTVTATLTVTDSLGCEDTAQVTVQPCSLCNIRIYGTYGEGAGKQDAIDPETSLAPENKPYSDPVAPFYPQALEAPRKDFITFNPAIMAHNNDPLYEVLDFITCDSNVTQSPAEKVFKRMWYEKEWFKDYVNNGEWDVVTDDGVMTLAEWEALDQWDRPAIREWNSPNAPDWDSDADIYGPAIVQEFTYMTLDQDWQPILVQNGSELLIPMAHDPLNPYRGLNSFDADDDGAWDVVRVESEETLGMDIDDDGVEEPMDADLLELNGNETVVFVLGPKDVGPGTRLQFFDHVVLLDGISQAGDDYWVSFRVEDNEGGDSTRYEYSNPLMQVGDTQYFYRGKYAATGEKPAFYLKLLSADYLTQTVTVEVGRMFGQTYANIEANQYRAQKMFMVDGVFYNVVAIKAQDNCFKYITFRQKLPKTPIKIFGKHLEVWNEDEILPEMPPYNLYHEILPDINPIDPEDPPYPIVKIPPEAAKKDMPPLEIFYVDETVEERYKGELLEIYNETEYASPPYEYWNLEWYWTLPWQYTEFRLPKGDRYLVTLSWIAPEAETTLWDGGDETDPVWNKTIDRFKFWYEDCTGPLYIDRATSSIRLYGTYGEGAGDQTATDPDNGYEPENKPYTDPVGPFFPQHEQAPVKDFMTFNPAIMDHNQGYPELDFIECGHYVVQTPKEKVFKRMWYEKEWFKEYIGSNTSSWDLVIEQFDPDGAEGAKWYFYGVMTLAQWNAMPDYVKIRDMLRVRQYNSPNLPDWVEEADIYGPAINQEFTYMTVDQDTMPIMVQAGSEILIPLAHYDGTPYRGLNSFDADGDQARDPVRVESEVTIDIDVDDDGVKELMNSNATELDGDEQIVLVLGPKRVAAGTRLQFFDHVVILDSVDVAGGNYWVNFRVEANEGDPVSRYQDITGMQAGDVEKFYRGKSADTGEKPVFYLKLLSADYNSQTARIEVGRMFGKTHANIEYNEYRAQKMMIVDNVFYNVVAVKTYADCFKYITIRQKLPKTPIKIFGRDLEVWTEGETLPEMSPFNMEHEILDDILPGWGAEPLSQQDKIGTKLGPVDPLNITYVEEDEEWRFLGELKEIYNETWNASTGIEEEYWNVEWFHTQPQQYTAFVMPEGQRLYLVTLAWYAPEAEITLWDSDPDGPVGNWTYDRVKFWYDPADNTDIYINRVGDIPEEEVTIVDYYNMAANGGDGIPWISSTEVINAVMDYLNDEGPFAPGSDPHFVKNDLLNYILAYLAQ